MSENRSDDRTSVTMTGRLLGEKLDSPCIILDLSASGARLQIQPGLFLPKQVTLHARDLGPDRVASIVWRNKTQMGVRF